jgi:hypothetical protein
VECEEDSISINISLIVSSYAEVFCSGLQQLLWENPMWRGPVICGHGPMDKDSSSLQIAAILQQLPGLLRTLKPDDFLPVSPFFSSPPSLLSSASPV